MLAAGLAHVQDPWLSADLVRACRKLWFESSSEGQEHAAAQPQRYPTIPSTVTGERDYSDPRCSPAFGVEVFARYHQAYPDARPFRLVTSIGTNDICHVGVENMASHLAPLGDRVVTSKIIEVSENPRSYASELMILRSQGCSTSMRCWGCRSLTRLGTGSFRC